MVFFEIGLTVNRRAEYKVLVQVVFNFLKAIGTYVELLDASLTSDWC